MPTPKPTMPPTQAFNDVLAKMMQAEVNEGGPPPATPCDTPVAVISQIHMTDPFDSPLGAEETMATTMTKQEFEQTLTKHLDQLRDQVQAARMKSVTLTDAAKAKWSATIADLDAKQKAARAKLAEVTQSTGDAWERLRDGAKDAWEDLERAVKQAVKEF